MMKSIVSVLMVTLILVSTFTLAFNVQLASASETIIDTHYDSRFTKYPSGPYWWSVSDHDTFRTRAYNNNFYYTYCGAEGQGDLYFGTWAPSISGEYDVYVWIPNPDPFGTYTPTHSAKYQIYHQYGYAERIVNQGLRLGGWYSIGRFTFNTGSSIMLNDRTGEPYLSTMIAFDAIRFVSVDPPNNPPYTPNNPYPSNYATSVSITADLSWSGGDPDPEDTVTYDVYFGASSSPPLVSSNQPATSYNLPTLSYLTTYYWKIVARDNHGVTTTGPLWVFTTGASSKTLTVYSSPSGVPFTANGISYSTPWSGTYSQGASVSLVMPSVYSGGDVRYYWDQWSDGVTSSSRTIILNTDTTVTGTYLGPYYELIVASSPISGIPFTINDASQTTSYSEWLYQGYYTIEMPATYNEYIWQHWLEDGDTNSEKTVLLTTSTMLTAVYSVSQNEPPVAIANPLYKLTSSGRIVMFDGSMSYDPDGGEIVRYWWNFGDGQEDEGAIVGHRFRGSMDQSKRYTVQLTVADDDNYLGFCEVDVDIEPLQKTLEVPVGYYGELLGACARMTAYYNWIGFTTLENGQYEDLYLISKIHFDGNGYISYLLSVWDTYSFSIGIPAWSHGLVLLGRAVSKDFVYPFGTYRDETYHFEGDGDFSGMVVGPSDKMRVDALNPAGVPGLIVIGASPGGVSTSFEPDTMSQVETSNSGFAYLGSPGELRVYDSQGRVTGLVNGEIKEEIPYSMYNSSLVAIFFPSDSYRYDVIGTGEGLYTLTVANTSISQEAPCFEAIYIPTNTTTGHQYVVDWAALSLGEEGVTVNVDSDGDSVPEYIFTSDSELTRHEYVVATTQFDVGLTDLTLPKTVIGEGYALLVNVTIANYGAHDETVNVSLYANETLIEMQTVTLTSGAYTTMAFSLDTAILAKGNYTFHAVTDTVPGETFTFDNTLFKGWVLVTLPGDVDSNRIVDIFDIVLMASVYGMEKQNVQYDPNCDIDDDSDIDIFDIVAAAVHYGESW